MRFHNVVSVGVDPVEKIAFGYVSGLVQDEWGYSVLIELESIERLFGYPIGFKLIEGFLLI